MTDLVLTDVEKVRIAPPRDPDDSPFADPQLSEAHVLVRRISLWPFVRVDLRGVDAAVHGGARDVLVARLNLVTGALTAFISADAATSLVAAHPRLRATRDGVRLDVVDDDSCKAAERLIRWQIDLVRFGPQMREASP